MRPSQFARLLVPLCMCANFADADWQYTSWGMPVDGVVSASGGAVSAGSPNVGGPMKDGSFVGASGKYTSPAGDFDATFVFDKSGGLIQVNLDQMDAIECQNTRRLMIEKYGAASESQERSAIWRDEKSGNVVTWSDNSVLHEVMPHKEPSCYLTYKALKGADSGV